jgi:hypothetical protein
MNVPAVRVRRERRQTVSRKQESLVARAYEQIPTFTNKMLGEMYAHAIERKVYYNDSALFDFMKKLETEPVSIEQFLDDPEYLGGIDLSIWPEVREAVVGICKDWWKGTSEAFAEALLMGATSTGKSTIATVITLYHVYLLHCLRQPQEVYGLPKTTSIVFPIMAAKPHVTKKVLYMPMRKMAEEIPWFQKHARLNKLIESEMYFEEKNIRVVPGGTDADAILGEAVIGGIIDEINFMNVVLKSKRAEVSTGRAGIFDQAATIYEAITRRKKSRFITQGPLLGVVCVSSSTRYKGDFTDKRHKQIGEFKERGTYVYNKKQYEVWPQDRYCGETFRLLVGNEALSDTRVLRDGEEVAEGAMVLDVPVEYKEDFLRSPHEALRDIVGISTSSISPFIRRRFKIQEAIGMGEEEELTSFLHKDNVILGMEGMPVVHHGHYCQNPSRPRYVHIDLSISGDRCGVAMVRFDGLKEVVREGGQVERLPMCSVELACSIEPDANNEIQIAEVRTWVKLLKDIHGYPIRVVTYDGFQSKESVQQWKREGMKTGYISVDKTSVPYKHLRDAFNEGRVKMFNNPVLVDELFNLEFDENKDKVDHPVKGSKDVADAVCGAYWTMLLRRASWHDAASDDAKQAQSDRAAYEERYEGERFR